MLELKRSLKLKSGLATGREKLTLKKRDFVEGVRADQWLQVISLNWVKTLYLDTNKKFSPSNNNVNGIKGS